ncbi:unnamed protein product [Cylindrotheca closterium]|uniref:type II protein arginine methyltransferase n=1 Tax=Cylindrotheca closterium TaxID=2856 RepID=A0AAD2FX71_9STRA|nr:unnamed protein product [Cylindrotheca closterium]
MLQSSATLGRRLFPTRRLPNQLCNSVECRFLVSSSKTGKKGAMKRQMEKTSADGEPSQAASERDATSAQFTSEKQVMESSTGYSSAFSNLKAESPKSHSMIDFSHGLEDDGWRSNKILDRLDQPDQLSFEKEAMFDPAIHLPYAPQDWKGYEAATPLSEFLFQRIGVSGQITTAEYMRHCLTNPMHGYYTRPATTLEKELDDDDWSDSEDDVAEQSTDDSTKDASTIFGSKGDFVTAPEISHVFGHCICVWLVTQWQSLQKPSKVQLVELGPGRGTLISDIVQLATSSKLSDFGEAIDSIHLVEASLELRRQQKEALENALGELVDFDFVNPPSIKGEEDETKEAKTDKNSPTKKFSIRVEWHADFSSFSFKRDRDLPVMMVLQEFIDALPVHVFQMTEEGWRERLIDVVSGADPKPEADKLQPRLRQVLAPNVTPAVELFLESANYHNQPVGTVVEVCPEGIMLVQDIAKVLNESDGAALIFDYGQEGTGDTLRAFSNHKQVQLTSSPGQVDITADVDFFALKQSIKDGETQGFGPVTQGEFLMRMGAGDMVIKKIEEPSTTEEEAVAFSEALKYLVMPENMGERFKVLAVGKKKEGIFAPPGMET